MIGLGQKPYRGRQIARWLFAKGCDSFEKMTDVSKSFREILSRLYSVDPLLTLQADESDQEGARRLLWRLSDGEMTESVILKEFNHHTLCVSSQVGCRMGCRFCRTGSMGLKRQLTQGEIVGQIIRARELLQPSPESLTNIVFMGMGEPLDNAENVLRSLKIITSPDYLAFSSKHISLSTVGVVPQIQALSEQGGLKCGLTISLGSADDDLRSSLMPCNKSWPLQKLKEALLSYPLPKGRRFTFAYVLLAGVNDSPEQALLLSKFLTGLKSKINLIPFNPWPGAPFKRPSPEATAAFQDVLLDKFHTAQIRSTKGASVNAACGLLAASQPVSENRIAERA